MDKFKKKFSVDFETYYAELLKQMLQWQLICRTDKGYRLTNRGVLLSNEVMEAFL